MRVVHCKREYYSVFIGRGSVFGNPFTHLPLDKTRAKVQVRTVEESVDCYREWLQGSSEWAHIEPERRILILAKIKQLKEDDILGCYCRPMHVCHGDVLVEMRTSKT